MTNQVPETQDILNNIGEALEKYFKGEYQTTEIAYMDNSHALCQSYKFSYTTLDGSRVTIYLDNTIRTKDQIL